MGSYLHTDTRNKPINLPVGKLVCVGRNYHDHIKEMTSEVPQTPLLFMKSQNALCDMSPHIEIPTHLGECHNEIEVALLIKRTINRASKVDIGKDIWGIGLALDLTLRDVQQELKQQGHPWERAKSFDKSCPVSPFTPWQGRFADGVQFGLQINRKIRQQGNTVDMIFSVRELLISIASCFTLHAGDIVLTGTPSGVGALRQGDEISAYLEDIINASTLVKSWP